MPGDTTVKRIAPGAWIDIDDPNTTYPARWRARQARRDKKVTLVSTPSSNLPGNSHNTTPTMSVVSVRAGLGFPALTSAQVGVIPPYTPLQLRLMDRLVQRQGVDWTDAHQIINEYGYNQAASYGHMRAAGATHTEAEYVIKLENPAVSLAYGKARAQNYTHTTALRNALNDDD